MSPHRSTDVGLHGSQSDVLEESFLGLQAWLPSAVNSQMGNGEGPAVPNRIQDRSLGLR